MFQQIIKLSADNGMKQLEVLNSVSHNVSNINTNGYKAHRFEQYLATDGRLEGVERVDTSQGSVMTTKRSMDVAIQGEGYIPLTQPDGLTAYTRDGSFTRNSDGFLVTHRGDLVGEGIQLPINYEDILIHPDGKVQAKLKGGLSPKDIGQISLYKFVNPEGLKSIGYNKLVPTENSGDPIKVKGEGVLKQGALERSNVNVFHQIDQILRLNASVISNYRVIKFSDDLYRQAVNLKQ